LQGAAVAGNWKALPVTHIAANGAFDLNRIKKELFHV
jgi:hypothetical protein